MDTRCAVCHRVTNGYLSNRFDIGEPLHNECLEALERAFMQGIEFAGGWPGGRFVVKREDYEAVVDRPARTVYIPWDQVAWRYAESACGGSGFSSCAQAQDVVDRMNRIAEEYGYDVARSYGSRPVADRDRTPESYMGAMA